MPAVSPRRTRFATVNHRPRGAGGKSWGRRASPTRRSPVPQYPKPPEACVGGAALAQEDVCMPTQNFRFLTDRSRAAGGHRRGHLALARPNVVTRARVAGGDSWGGALAKYDGSPSRRKRKWAPTR
ncbi:hypothetical protein MKEN_00369200 [Mycena kentingensis (nom. inval.)]|nr:hypothetical protein MKEN_00369200 [Mycena kentingensis (nom. inval.)]